MFFPKCFVECVTICCIFIAQFNAFKSDKNHFLILYIWLVALPSCEIPIHPNISIAWVSERRDGFMLLPSECSRLNWNLNFAYWFHLMYQSLLYHPHILLFFLEDTKRANLIRLLLELKKKQTFIWLTLIFMLFISCSRSVLIIFLIILDQIN